MTSGSAPDSRSNPASRQIAMRERCSQAPRWAPDARGSSYVLVPMPPLVVIVTDLA